MRPCLLVTSDAILVKSHQPEQPNMSRTKRKPTNIPNTMGKNLMWSQAYQPIQRTIGN